MPTREGMSPMHRVDTVWSGKKRKEKNRNARTGLLKLNGHVADAHQGRDEPTAQGSRS